MVSHISSKVVPKTLAAMQRRRGGEPSTASRKTRCRRRVRQLPLNSLTLPFEGQAAGHLPRSQGSDPQSRKVPRAVRFSSAENVRSEQYEWLRVVYYSHIKDARIHPLRELQNRGSIYHPGVLVYRIATGYTKLPTPGCGVNLQPQRCGHLSIYDRAVCPSVHYTVDKAVVHAQVAHVLGPIPL